MREIAAPGHFALHGRRTLKAPIRTGRPTIAYVARLSGSTLQLTGERMVLGRDCPLVRLTAPVTITAPDATPLDVDPTSDLVFLAADATGAHHCLVGINGAGRAFGKRGPGGP